MLGNELCLAGVRAVVVVERLDEPSRQSRAGGVQPRTAEVLDLRGLLDPLLDGALPRGGGGHFAGLPVPLDCSSWRTRYPTPVAVPQRRIEALLEGRLAGYRSPVLHGAEVTSVRQDTGGVTAETARHTVTSRYLVAYDGGHSSVRKLLGVAFPGQPSTISAVVDIKLARADDLPEPGHFSQFIRSGGGYWTVLHPIEDGLHRMVLGSRAWTARPRSPRRRSVQHCARCTAT